MNCYKCGAEIQTVDVNNRKAMCCTKCGTLIGYLKDDEINDKKKVKKSDIKNVNVKKVLKRSIIVLLIVALLAGLGLGFYNYKIKKTIRNTTEKYVEKIKEGLSNEEIDKIVAKLSGDNAIVSYIAGTIFTGENINDFYHVVTKHMEYEILDVKRITWSDYAVTIKVRNVSMKEVVEYAVNSVVDDAKNASLLDNLKKLFGFAKNDISMQVTEKINESADVIYNQGRYIEMEHTIEFIKEDDTWSPKLGEDIDKLILTCFGIN